MNHTKKFMQSLGAIATATILLTAIQACSENNNEPPAPTDTKDTALRASPRLFYRRRHRCSQ